MSSVKNGRLLFNEIPTSYPEPGKTTVYDESETIDLDLEPLKGGFLVKTLYLSVDPYLRGLMRDPDIESYFPPFLKGQPLQNFGVGVVLRSEDAQVKVGDYVYGIFPFMQYFVRPSLAGFLVLENKEGLPWPAYLGVMGMPGQTAYCAWKEYAHVQPGDVVFVTSAAGPVGSFVVQLAKADGCKVIASAGSDAKCDFVKSIGADVVFNYKKQKTADVLAREGPINIFWDNVGGESLEAALQHAATGARFIESGMISAYNVQAPPVTSLMQIIAKELHIHGFLLLSLLPKYSAAFYAEIPARVAKGEFKYLEDVKKGLKLAGHAISDVQQGRNHGKSIVQVADE